MKLKSLHKTRLKNDTFLHTVAYPGGCGLVRTAFIKHTKKFSQKLKVSSEHFSSTGKWPVKVVNPYMIHHMICHMIHHMILTSSNCKDSTDSSLLLADSSDISSNRSILEFNISVTRVHKLEHIS